MSGSSSTGGVYRLLYSSHSRIPASERPPVLAELFSQARSHNRAAGITGALLITDHYFVQVLEGAKDVVDTLFARIEADPRHDDVTLIERADAEPRVFTGWAMAEISSMGHADIPLHVTDGALKPRAPGRFIPEQDRLLTRMRNVIGADTV